MIILPLTITAICMIFAWHLIQPRHFYAEAGREFVYAWNTGVALSCLGYSGLGWYIYWLLT